jgi:hypothetical protein
MTDKTTKPWKYALVQHPMWLLIAEDMVCAERTPPWGCPSLEEYVQRLVLSLDSQDRFPWIHINFDFSAVELEDLAERYPHLVARLRKLTNEGRVSFVNGTYSQPHLQILSVESTIRQFQYGLKSIEKLTGYKATCYCAQEPGLTPQLPQILRAFGFDTATGPSFPYGVKLHGGFIQHWDNDWEWIHGDDIPNWLGLDGSRIPIWLKKSFAPDDAIAADDRQHGLLGPTRLRADILDMVEVTSEWVEDWEKHCSICRIDTTLAEMVRAEPPQYDAEIDANYAYTEGVDAEALSRANTAAETALLTLEALEAALGSGESGFDYDSAWKLFMKAQHHDAYWTGGPELRAKSVAWLEEVSESASDKTGTLAAAFAQKLPATTEDARAMIVLHPYAKPHNTPATLHAGAGPLRITDHLGQAVKSQPRGEGVVFVASSDGLGYQAWVISSQESDASRESLLHNEHQFSNEFYSAAIRPDGSIAKLTQRASPHVAATDSNAWLYQEDARDVVLQPTDQARLIQGPVFDSVEASCPADTWDLTTRLTFYHELPWFEVETELDFREPTEIGDYFDDRSKLHYAWSLGIGTSIRHAVGGCPWSARPRRTFTASPWLDARTEAGGVAFCLFNATKCWIDADGVLRFVAAWGHNGDHFHNRQGPLPGIMGPLSWLKPMDIRLRGKHTVKYAVWPHASDVTEGEVADWAASLLLPPVAFPVETGGGQEAWKKSFLSLTTPGAVPLSVRRQEDDVILRMMESAGQSAQLAVKSDAGWTVSETLNLDGTSAPSVEPYKILEARLRR